MIAVYVASLIRKITEAMANRGKNIETKSDDRLLIIYFWSLFILSSLPLYKLK